MAVQALPDLAAHSIPWERRAQSAALVACGRRVWLGLPGCPVMRSGGGTAAELVAGKLPSRASRLRDRLCEWLARGYNSTGNSRSRVLRSFRTLSKRQLSVWQESRPSVGRTALFRLQHSVLPSKGKAQSRPSSPYI